MSLLKDIKLYFRAKKNKKFDISEIEDFLANIKLDSIKNILSGESNLDTKLTSKFAIYSTYCGPTSRRKFERKFIQSNVPHYFISNNLDVLDSAKKYGWTPFYLDIPVYDNLVYSAYQSKIAKALPHIFSFLNQHDYTMYLDDKLFFDEDLLYDFEKLLLNNEAALALREHDFLKANVLAEFAESMLQKRYYVLKDRTIKYLNIQINSGRSLQLSKLYRTGAIFRNMRHSRINEINENWYQNILDCGINCQISFDILAQSYKDIVTLPGHLKK